MGTHRLFFASDIHGSEVAFRKFLNAAKAYRADALIMGGDLSGKVLVFVTRGPDGYRTNLFGNERQARTDGELDQLVKEIRRSGYYPYIGGPEEVRELAASPAKAEAAVEERIRAVLVGWLRLAEERLRPAGVRLYMSPGNDDPPWVGGVLDGSDWVVNPDERIVEVFDRFEMASVGKANLTPWHCPRDVPEPQLGEIVGRLTEALDKPRRAILNLHAPPYGTNLDVAMQLDERFRPVMRGGQPVMTNVGSPSVRRAVERSQPLVALHGHIHESKAAERLGGTMCFNPGSEYSEGILRGLLLTISDEGELKNYVFTTG